MLEFFLIILIGILVSSFGTVVGFGGGIFMVPVLIIAFGFPIDLAIGSVMLALVPSAFISTWFNFRNQTIDYVVGTMLQVPTIAGTIAGALLVSYIPVLELQYIFAAFVLTIGLVMLRSARRRESRKKNFFYKLNALKPVVIRKNKQLNKAYRLSFGMVGFFGLLGGLLAGLFGVGGGFLQTPVMIKVFRIPPRIATATSLFVIALTSLVGSISHYSLGHIQWPYSAPVLLGFAMGALIGRFFSARIQKSTLEYVIGIGLLLAAVGVLVNTFIR